MNDYFDSLAQHLLNKPSLNDCSLQEVQNLAALYPYFSEAQFLLLKKLDKNSDEYRAQYQKAILYHHNPLEFDTWWNAEKYAVEYPTPLPLNKEESVPEKEIENLAEKEIEIDPVPDPAPQPLPEPEPQSIPQVAVESQVSLSKTEDLAFEPYHTVDYFASQGIKLSQEEATKDKFGKQLKSFTEWLKTMKKLPATEIEKNIDVVTENKVENLAAHSVEDSEIATEAMAEVWIKQGNRQKAIEVYNKLSLLNPSKRAYFAAKIENLKNS